MKTLRTVASAFGHAAASPGLVAWLLLVTLLLALPNAMVVREAVENTIGASLDHQKLRAGYDMEWHSDYQFNNSGVATLLTPTSIRPAAFLDNLDAWFTGSMFETFPSIVALGVLVALLWSLMSGGILYRYVHHDRPFSLRTLLARGATYFPRFVRLMAVTAILYYGTYRLARMLFGRLDEMMRDVTVETTVLIVNLIAATGVLSLLILVKLISDYAKVATVLEDRRSMVLAAYRGLRFVLRHPLRTFGAYATIAVIGFGLLALYARVAPGQDQTTLFGVLVAFTIAQAFLAARIIQRLTVYAAAVEIYRDESSD